MQKGDKVIVDNIINHENRHSGYLGAKGVVLFLYGGELAVVVTLDTGSIVAFAESELKLDEHVKQDS